MWIRLRQIALVAHSLAPVVDDLRATFGVDVCFSDPGVATFGLENALLPFGNQFVEIVAPVTEGTAGGRYLERRGGDGGYMVITQCDDHAPRRARIAELGVRIAYQFSTHEYHCMQLHPKDTGGSFLEIDEQTGPGAHDVDGPWEPAGPDWKRGQRLECARGITAAEVQADDPAGLAERWASITSSPCTTDAAGRPTVAFENAVVRFVPCTDGRPEGLGGIDVAVVDPALVRERAATRGLLDADGFVRIGGLRITPVSA